MTGNVVARRYARALFALGKKTGLPELESYASGLGALRSALTESGSRRTRKRRLRNSVSAWSCSTGVAAPADRSA